VLPLTAVLLLVFNIGLEGGGVIRSLHGQMKELLAMVLVLYGVSLLLSLPTWMFLRLAHLESSLTYVLAGLVEGLLCAFYVGYSNTGALRLDQALGFLLLSFTGGFIAWAFWWIARDSRERSQPE
jgi:hypothetical protein